MHYIIGSVILFAYGVIMRQLWLMLHIHRYVITTMYMTATHPPITRTTTLLARNQRTARLRADEKASRHADALQHYSLHTIVNHIVLKVERAK